jgi:hypothetical protein
MSSPGSTGRSSNSASRNEGGGDWMPAFAGMTIASGTKYLTKKPGDPIFGTNRVHRIGGASWNARLTARRPTVLTEQKRLQMRARIVGI